ncbi:MAG: porin [Ignavibacteriaceae bacterium]
MKQFLLLSLAVLTLFPSVIFSQSDEEPLYEEFKNVFSKQYLKLGLLVQFGGNFQYEPIDFSNGFKLNNFRLKLSGKFDKGIGYAVQTSFIRSPAILDARIYYEISEAFIVDAGLYKSPFSREFLISSSNTDFINRAQIADLAPNRQIGVTARGLFPSTDLNYSIGVFNGNRFSNAGNDNNDMLYVGRLSFTPDITGGKNKSNKFEIAVNAAQSNDMSVNISGIDPMYNGKRFLAGGDARLELDKWLITGEAVFGKFEPAFSEEFEPFGYQATLGYMICENFQGLLRWDSFKIDGDLNADELVVMGLNIWPTQISKFQVNYVVPVNSIPKHHQLLVNAQISF